LTMQASALALIALISLAFSRPQERDAIVLRPIPQPLRECAVWFGHTLDVRAGESELTALRVPRDVNREPQILAPQGLPFDPGPAFKSAGTWQVVSTSGGWLVGLDHGEFLGGLWWFAENGAATQVLSRLNVISIFAQGAQAVVVADDGVRGGAVVLLKRVDGAWHRDREVALSDRVLASAEIGRESLVVLGENRVFWLSGDAVVRAVDLPFLTRGMRPFLFSQGADGTLYVGMSLHVLAVSVSGSVQWLVEEGCERPRLEPAPDPRGRHTPWWKACVCS
jgi:hypothetical protein